VDDLTKLSKNLNANKLVLLLTLIVTHDKFDGEKMAMEVCTEVAKALTNLSRCPRDVIKFFHPHIHCDCLKELYDRLKDTTKRTTPCALCGKVEDRRKRYECSDCKLIPYCSRKCAKAHYPEHKNYCKIRFGSYMKYAKSGTE
jgi:hypothetical protein